MICAGRRQPAPRKANQGAELFFIFFKIFFGMEQKVRYYKETHSLPTNKIDGADSRLRDYFRRDATMAKVADRSVAVKGKSPEWMILGIVALVAVAAGVVVPLFLLGGKSPAGSGAQPAAKPPYEFGEVIVNINDGNNGRFLQLKLKLVIDMPEKPMNTLMDAKKPYLKDWLIRHLRKYNLKDLQSSRGDDRLRQEIQDEFNKLLFGDESGKIQTVLFDEYRIQ